MYTRKRERAEEREKKKKRERDREIDSRCMIFYFFHVWTELVMLLDEIMMHTWEDSLL